VDTVIRTVINNENAPDFLMCIGNDRSDEDMFESINEAVSRSVFPTAPDVFACSVGQKASKAKYYVDGCSEVIRLLKGVTAITPRREVISQSQVTFRDILEVVS
jgi:trehalose 6-phosphate synthase/phosphatase